MSFTDQKQRVATQEDCRGPWSGGRNGERFRCYICGYKFLPGDNWRWVCGGDLQTINFIVCDRCDGPDVKERWIKHHNLMHRCAFWMRD